MTTAAAAADANAVGALQRTMADPRFARGEALLKEKRLEEAVVAFEDLLRTMCESEGLDDSLAIAPVYYAYGHALLALAEATASVFGGAVQAAGADGDGDGEAEADARDAADDMEAAWEMLEGARVIYSRYPGELPVEQQLARVYTRLGDYGSEADNFAQARADYEKAVVVRRKVLQASGDDDTTQLADLYCCLAISCIYKDATTTVSDDQDAKDEEKKDEEEPQERGEYEGLKFYVLAGRVMAENIHRRVLKCAEHVQKFVEERIPKYTELIEEKKQPKGKGKRKAGSADDASRSLLYTSDNMDKVRDEFIANVKSQETKREGVELNADELTKDEAQVLDYIEIYVEIKEKVDGLKESITAEPVEQQNGAKTEAVEAVTTIGFGAPSTTAAPAATVNVISVKKRKTETPTDGGKQ